MTLSGGKRTLSEEVLTEAAVLARTPKPLPYSGGARKYLYSSDLGKCPRSLWLRWRGLAVDDPAFGLHRGALGHAVEDLMADRFRAAGILAERERTFYLDSEPLWTVLPLKGRADFILRWGGRTVIAELKTTAAYSRMLKEPMTTHLLQLRSYLMAAKLPLGFLIYYSLAMGSHGEWFSWSVDRRDAEVRTAVFAADRAVLCDHEPLCRDPPGPRGGKRCFDCMCVEGG